MTKVCGVACVTDIKPLCNGNVTELPCGGDVTATETGDAGDGDATADTIDAVAVLVCPAATAVCC